MPHGVAENSHASPDQFCENITPGCERLRPLGQRLADLICSDLLESPSTHLSLDEAAEMARYRVGPKELNRYLFDLFNSFKPSPVHLGLVQLPWNSLFTTNYDLLIEAASNSGNITPAGEFKPVLSVLTDVSIFSESDILYYKLHGSIDLANTDAGRLILTKEDYRYYEDFRKPLFRRLKQDLLNQTFVFFGYSLGDTNFRAILEDCRAELGTSYFPQSFAIRRGASQVESVFWREKYNIHSLNIEGLSLRFCSSRRGTRKTIQ